MMPDGNPAEKIAQTPRSGREASGGTPYTLESYRPEESLGFLAGRFLNLINDGIDLALKGTGLNSHRFGILHALLRGKVSSPTGIARLRYQNGAAVTYNLNLLEKQGLIVRVPSETDRRITELKLTAEGENLTRRCLPLVVEAQNRVLSPVGPEEHALMVRLLSRLTNWDDHIEANATTGGHK